MTETVQQAPLKALGSPRKINLAEELELAGVVVPQEVAEAIPAEQPVFCPTSSAGLRTSPRS
jgi:hypothetical protein